MPAYDDHAFRPPAPVLKATVRNPGTGASVVDVMMLIDSGADVTLLPVMAINTAGIEPAQTEYASSLVSMERDAFRGRFMRICAPSDGRFEGSFSWWTECGGSWAATF